MKFAEFHNALRIFTSIDRPDFPGTDMEWLFFREDPYRYFIRCDDDQAQKLWAVIEARQPKRAEA